MKNISTKVTKIIKKVSLKHAIYRQHVYIYYKKTIVVANNFNFTKPFIK